MTVNLFIKRVFDIMCSFLALIILSPVFLVVAVAIKLDSKGPVFFSQKRLTRGRSEFDMYKFRSMYQNVEFSGTGLFNFENDNRVTRVGRFLRNSSIDELPQLFNILLGQMSFVGPRPPVVYELGDYQTLNRTFSKRFDMKAGITGLAQIRGRNDLPWDIKVKYDNEYIELFKTYGILIDLKILFLTVFKVLAQKSIYEMPTDSASDPVAIAKQEEARIMMLAHTIEEDEMHE